ncbi:hypothetical protein, partial [Citrobacter youngae]|uniref:hypothetical protein n=1 Tax=Citrobacter youngae TaxID=133448 RepID=UPI001954A4AD
SRKSSIALAMGSGFRPTAIIQTSHVIIAQVAYTFSVVLAGLNVIGMVKCAQIVAEKHLALSSK